MDVDYQKNHLKAYGLTYWTLEKGISKMAFKLQRWFFLLPLNDNIRKECIIRGVSYEIFLMNLQVQFYRDRQCLV